VAQEELAEMLSVQTGPADVSIPSNSRSHWPACGHLLRWHI